MSDALVSQYQTVSSDLQLTLRSTKPIDPAFLAKLDRFGLHRTQCRHTRMQGLVDSRHRSPRHRRCPNLLDSTLKASNLVHRLLALQDQQAVVKPTPAWYHLLRGIAVHDDGVAEPTISDDLSDLPSLVPCDDSHLHKKRRFLLSWLKWLYNTRSSNLVLKSASIPILLFAEWTGPRLYSLNYLYKRLTVRQLTRVIQLLNTHTLAITEPEELDRLLYPSISPVSMPSDSKTPVTVKPFEDSGCFDIPACKSNWCAQRLQCVCREINVEAIWPLFVQNEMKPKWHTSHNREVIWKVMYTQAKTIQTALLTTTKDTGTMYVYRTHVWNAHIEKMYTGLCRDVGAEHVWILYDLTNYHNGTSQHLCHVNPLECKHDTECRTPPLETFRGRQIFYVTEEMCRNINRLHRTGYESVESPLMLLYRDVFKARTNYDFMYVVEYDVGCHGNWYDVLTAELIKKGKYSYDFMAANVCPATPCYERKWFSAGFPFGCVPRNDNPRRFGTTNTSYSPDAVYFGHSLSMSPEQKWGDRFIKGLNRSECYVSFFPVVRLSRKFLDRIETKYLGIVTAYCETFFPTVALAETDLFVSELGLKFVDFQYRNLWYTTETWSTVYKDVHGLYHPIR